MYFKKKDLVRISLFKNDIFVPDRELSKSFKLIVGQLQNKRNILIPTVYNFKEKGFFLQGAFSNLGTEFLLYQFLKKKKADVFVTRYLREQTHESRTFAIDSMIERKEYISLREFAQKYSDLADKLKAS